MTLPRAATDKQLALMTELGVPIPPACSFELATESIGLAQIVLRYVSQLANRNWQIRVEDEELRAVVRAVLAAPQVAAQIRENMEASSEVAFLAARDWEDDPHGSGAKRAKVELRDVTPDLKEDASYFFVKMQLEKHIPRLTGRMTVPLPAARATHTGPRIFLAQETRWEKLKRHWNELKARRSL